MDLNVYLKYLLVFSVAFLATYSLVPIYIRILRRAGFVDHPGRRRINANSIPRGGGITVFAGFHLGCWALFYLPWGASFQGSLDVTWWHKHLLVSALLLLVGLIDDAHDLFPLWKLTGQTCCALLMFVLGVSVNNVFGAYLPPLADLCLTMLWFLTIINAFNLIDGLDGLATGLAILSALGMASLQALQQQPSDVLVLLALMGAALAFLRYNFFPARIFLGDSGSMFLGFTLAAAALGSNTKSSTVASIGVPLLAMGVPIFDTMLAVWRRSLRSLWPWSQKEKLSSGLTQADLEHLHHRLLRLGFNQRRVALLLYCLSGFLILVGILGYVWNSRAPGIFLIAFTIGSYVVVRHLASIELWDSGSRILKGLDRPSSSVVIMLMSPIIDLALLAVALLVTLTLSFNRPGLPELRSFWLGTIPIWTGMPFMALVFSASYSKVWSRARASDYLILVVSLALGTAAAWGSSIVIGGSFNLEAFAPVVLYFSVSVGLLTFIRIFPRILRDLMARLANGHYQTSRFGQRNNILVYGAGHNFMMFIRETAHRLSHTQPSPELVGLLDDDRNLRGRLVYGYPVLGNLMDLPRILGEQNIFEIVLTEEIPDPKLTKLKKLALRYNIRLSQWRASKDVIDLNQPDLNTLEERGEQPSRDSLRNVF